jgi:hypothetical protein
MNETQLTREYVAHWAVFDHDAWALLTEGADREGVQRLLRDALYTADAILKMCNLPLAPLKVGVDYNIWPHMPLLPITCDMSPDRDFAPLWLWSQELEDGCRQWWWNSAARDGWGRWRKGTKNQVRAYLLTRLVGKGKFARSSAKPSI